MANKENIGIGMPHLKNEKRQPLATIDEEVAEDEFFELLNGKRKIITPDPVIAPTIYSIDKRVERLEAILEKLHSSLTEILPKENPFNPKRTKHY